MQPTDRIHELPQQKINQLSTEANYARREYARLKEAGLKGEAPIEPDAIDKALGELLACQAEIKRTNPATPEGSKRLQELLDREKFLLESLERLRTENSKSLRTMQERYIAEVETIFIALRVERADNDQAIKAAIAELARLLQARWEILTRFKRADKSLESSLLQTGKGNQYSSRLESSWPRNFGIAPLRTYEDMVKPFLARVSLKLGSNGAESANPATLSESIFKDR
jgi:hypothetical protein